MNRIKATTRDTADLRSLLLLVRELQRVQKARRPPNRRRTGTRPWRSTSARWRSIPTTASTRLALDRARREASRAHFEKGKVLRAEAASATGARSVPSRAARRDRAAAHRQARSDEPVRGRRAHQGRPDDSGPPARRVRAGLDRRDQEARAGEHHQGPAAAAQSRVERADLADVLARHAGQGHLPGPRQRLRHQRPVRSGRQGRPHHHRAPRRHRPAGARARHAGRAITSTRSSTRRPSSSSPTTRRPAAITKTSSSARSISRTATPSRSPTSCAR